MKDFQTGGNGGNREKNSVLSVFSCSNQFAVFMQFRQDLCRNGTQGTQRYKGVRRIGYGEIAAKRRKKRKISFIYAPFVHFRGNSLLPVCSPCNRLLSKGLCCFFFAISAFFCGNSTLVAAGGAGRICGAFRAFTRASLRSSRNARTRSPGGARRRRLRRPGPAPRPARPTPPPRP